MTGRPPELFARDLKFLVSADPPHSRRTSGSHSHWLATAVIAVLVGVWLGSEPSASIDIESASRNAPQGQAAQPLAESQNDAADPASNAAADDLEDVWALAGLGDGTPIPETDTPAAAGFAFGPHRQLPVEQPFAAVFPAVSAPPPADTASAPEPEPEPGLAETAFPVPPSLELATGFEEQQSDIELVAVDTRFNFTAMDSAAGSGWNVVDIKKGDTLSTIFRHMGVHPDITHRLTRDENGKLLNALSTGPNLKVRFGSNGDLEALRYNIDAVRILAADFDGDNIATTIEKRAIEIREREVSARIRSSLFQAGSQAGLSDQFVLRLAAIFKYSIDFNRDLQPGDAFSVIFEEKFIDDRKFATGGIVAAAFRVGDRTFTAVRHVEPDGTVSYFSADGDSLKRAFLRSPVKFTRISSKFSLNRFHPVLKKWKAHKGVDYAAARGTPVLATADGVVKRIGRNGGYGKAVILQHGKSYSTLYAHLNGFARKLKAGDRVRQGQVIGYVGSTGLATGPHLHYEFRVNGVHKNPLTVNVPRALPMAGSDRDDFLRLAGQFEKQLVALLDAGS